MAAVIRPAIALGSGIGTPWLDGSGYGATFAANAVMPLFGAFMAGPASRSRMSGAVRAPTQGGAPQGACRHSTSSALGVVGAADAFATAGPPHELRFAGLRWGAVRTENGLAVLPAYIAKDTGYLPGPWSHTTRLGIITTLRLHKTRPIMRLLMTAVLLAGVTATYAQAPASGQKSIANDTASTAMQEAFRMPASEQRNIAGNPSWTAPQKPLHVYGNTWYVGPQGLGVFLITAPTGDVLIDGGVPGDAALIEANIRGLGVNLRDIKWILNSHAHFDHAGDMAKLAHDTGAQVIAGAADVSLLERGGHDDPEYGDRLPFPPVHVTRGVADGERLHLGDLVLTAHATPGHTKGNTTWTWMSCEGKRCLHMVDVGSLSAPGFKLVGNPKYPDSVEDFEHSFAVVAALPCDIPIAPHPGMVDFWERVAKREHGDANALLDPTGCRTYAAAARKNFEAELAKQRADAAAPK